MVKINQEQQNEILERIEKFKEALHNREKLDKHEKDIIFEKYIDKILSNIPLVGTTTKTSEGVKILLKDVPFAELVRKAKVKQHPDIVLLATYDLMVNKGNQSATTAEILNQYSEALIKPSTNTSADIRVNRSKGYMMTAEQKEGKMGFKITMSGIEYIEGVLKNAEQ